MWRAGDWIARFSELEIVLKLERDPRKFAAQALQLAELCEHLIPDRERALSLYTIAFKGDESNLRALARIRFICRELGQLDMVSKVADLEYEHTKNPECLKIAGLALLDLGDPNRALKRLLKASKGMPDDEELAIGLQTARREWPNVREAAEQVEERAAGVAGPAAARLYLQAARMHRMLEDDHQFAAMVRSAFEADPRDESAFTLLGIQLRETESWDELESAWNARADVACSDYERVDIYRRAGFDLAVRCKQPDRGAPLLVRSLLSAYDADVQDVPCHMATLILVSEIGEVSDALALTERALTMTITDDERVGLSLLAAKLAWHSLGDHQVAWRHLQEVAELAPQNPQPEEFARQGLVPEPESAGTVPKRGPAPAALRALERVQERRAAGLAAKKKDD